VDFSIRSLNLYVSKLSYAYKVIKSNYDIVCITIGFWVKNRTWYEGVKCNFLVLVAVLYRILVG
jgi:hypothetical protein